ncbi:dnaJ homolog subfamily C member 7-like [Tubulanus polymorphus]|uniref:dnaJ homolog subfamily C member 7-like n=1 Tax=Tubulanus polymorphus TaxID=672921 RepID=UPI003DA27DA1
MKMSTVEECAPMNKSTNQMESDISDGSSDQNAESMEVDEGPEAKAFMAEEKKSKGNVEYQKKNYKAALELYNQAIDLCPDCAAYYGNRCATSMMLGRYKEALDDARKAVSIDDKFVKGYIREGKCLLALGDVLNAERVYEHVLRMEPENNTVKEDIQITRCVKQFEESAEKDILKGDYRRALFCMDRCLQRCPQCVRFKVKKAEALCFLKRYPEARDITNDLLQSDSLNADAIYIRGLCLYYDDNVDKAFQHFQQVLRLAPDHVKAKLIYKKAKLLIQKKEEGNQAFRSGKFDDAYRIYTEALEIDPHNIYTNSKLYCNRATVCAKLNKLEQAKEDCTQAIELDGNYLKAYLRRAKCFMDLEKFEEAVQDYEKVYKIDKTRENKSLLDAAKLELKKSKRKDYYKILGIEKCASEAEIKKAYRKRALIHHPDRHSHATTEKQKEEELKFKELGEAYSILSDSKKKSRYDSGQDLEEMEGGFGDIDPNSIFQMFFSGPGNFQFSSGGQQGGYHSHGFPGGFSFQF